MTSPSVQGLAGFSSLFGQMGPGEAVFRARTVIESLRFMELDRRESYFGCSQHDHKKYDFDGRVLKSAPGALATMPMMSQDVMPYFIPLALRRPSTPYRLAKVIVKAFTKMLFGEGRFPRITVDGDEASQDFANAIIDHSNLKSVMTKVRNLGGSVGTAGLSWCWDSNGKPRFQAHNGKHLFVHEWEDREQLVPKAISEVFLHSRDEWDGEQKAYVRNWYWFRRMWTLDSDLLFMEQKYVKGVEPDWIIDEKRSMKHDDGVCHIEWIQNSLEDDPDGLPDYDGCYENFDQLDILLSVISKGAIVNLDPTLVLRVDPIVSAASNAIKKGSDNALMVGTDGGAEYLELSGTSLTTGVNLFNEKRKAVLEVCECVLPDPDKVAAQGTSAVAMKMYYATMLGACDALRTRYGEPMKRALQNMIEAARSRVGKTVQVPGENGEPEDAVLAVNLPKRVERTPKLDEDGTQIIDEKTGKGQEDVTTTDRIPGEAEELEVSWPPYFALTADDQSKIVTVLATAAGGKAVVSQQTAVEEVAEAFGRNPDEEWSRVQKMSSADQEAEMAQAQAFGAQGDFQGGAVEGQEDLPPGAEKKPEDDEEEPPAGPPGAKKPPFGGKPPKPSPFGGKPGKKPPFGK